MAMLADPAAVAFGVWQSREYHGAELVNEPGSLLRNTCETGDPAGVAEFSARVHVPRDRAERAGRKEIPRRSNCRRGISLRILNLSRPCGKRGTHGVAI